MGTGKNKDTNRTAVVLAADRAQRLLQVGRHQEAIHHAERVLVSEPAHVGALETLAKALWHTGQYDPLLPILRRLIEINPYEPGYYSLLGAVYQSLGQCGAAVRAYARCVDCPGTEGANARERIAALQEWETGLIADLIASDIVFRAQYAQDPALACSQRGFEFHQELTAGEAWLPDHAVAASFVRPS